MSSDCGGGHDTDQINILIRCQFETRLVKSLLMVRAEIETPVSAVSIRLIPRVPADVPLYDKLNEFQKGSSHMATIMKPKGKPKNFSAGDGEKWEEWKEASGDSKLTTPLLYKVDEKSERVVINIDDLQHKEPNGNKPASYQQHDSVINAAIRAPEDIEDGEVVAIITLEAVFEELLQRLGGRFPPDEAVPMMKPELACTLHMPSNRTKMEEAVNILEMMRALNIPKPVPSFPGQPCPAEAESDRWSTR